MLGSGYTFRRGLILACELSRLLLGRPYLLYLDRVRALDELQRRLSKLSRERA